LIAEARSELVNREQNNVENKILKFKGLKTVLLKAATQRNQNKTRSKVVRVGFGAEKMEYVVVASVTAVTDNSIVLRLNDVIKRRCSMR